MSLTFKKQVSLQVTGTFVSESVHSGILHTVPWHTRTYHYRCRLMIGKSVIPPSAKSKLKKDHCNGNAY